MDDNNLIKKDFVDFLEKMGTNENKAEQRIYAELRRRKKSKKARQRLVRGILRCGHGANHGSFAREVCVVFGIRAITKLGGDFLRAKMAEPSIARQIFPVEPVVTPGREEN